MQVGRVTQTLDRDDLVAFMHDREREAAIDTSPVDEKRASPALAVIAALFCAGEFQLLAKRVQKGGAQIKREVPDLAVDGQCDLG